MNGRVLFFDNPRGWGFIRGKDNEDYFVHYSNIDNDGNKNLSDDDIVTFEVGIGANGKEQAIHVKPLYTRSMVKKILKEKGNHIKTIKDKNGNRRYIVFSPDDVMQMDERGMSFDELVLYAGLHY